VSVAEQAEVPFGHFGEALTVRETEGIEGRLDFKFYAPGIGLGIEVSAGSGPRGAVDFTRGP
jgi:hypothetical protein